jgi:hypothetical protein
VKPSWKVIFTAAAVGVLGLMAFAPSGSKLSPAVAQAQTMTPRTVSGAVLDAGDKPLVGATVFLKSLKTKTIRSFTSVEMGHFYFAQVSRIEDYELWAEKDGKKTVVKTVSSWDSRAKFVSDLKIK